MYYGKNFLEQKLIIIYLIIRELQLGNLVPVFFSSSKPKTMRVNNGKKIYMSWEEADYDNIQRIKAQIQRLQDSLKAMPS